MGIGLSLSFTDINTRINAGGRGARHQDFAPCKVFSPSSDKDNEPAWCCGSAHLRRPSDARPVQSSEDASIALAPVDSTLTGHAAAIRPGMWGNKAGPGAKNDAKKGVRNMVRHARRLDTPGGP